jgi:antitoxin (DNA-binding transcriptional repressor) of toxin-antitoxin stability system
VECRSLDHSLSDARHHPAALRYSRSTACYAVGVSRQISQRELRNQSGEIMRQLDEGETFIVTRNGVPVGELLPLRRHRFVATETAVELFRCAPKVDYRQFRADLDATASQAIEPRA